MEEPKVTRELTREKPIRVPTREEIIEELNKGARLMYAMRKEREEYLMKHPPNYNLRLR